MSVMNLGIIMYITGGNVATYRDRFGVLRNAQTNLTDMAWRRCPAIPAIGYQSRLTLTVSGSLAGLQSVLIRPEIRYRDLRDVTSGVTWYWSSIAMVRLDGSAAAQAEITIAGADFTVASEQHDVVLGTANIVAAGEFSLIIQSTIPVIPADFIVIAAEAAS